MHYFSVSNLFFIENDLFSFKGALYLEPRKRSFFLIFLKQENDATALWSFAYIIFRYISEPQFLIFYVFNIFKIVAVAAIFRKFSEKSIFTVIILQPKPII